MVAGFSHLHLSSVKYVGETMLKVEGTPTVQPSAATVGVDSIKL